MCLRTGSSSSPATDRPSMSYWTHLATWLCRLKFRSTPVIFPFTSHLKSHLSHVESIGLEEISNSPLLFFFFAIWCFSYRWWLTVMMNSLFPSAAGSPHKEREHGCTRSLLGSPPTWCRVQGLPASPPLRGWKWWHCWAPGTGNDTGGC